MVMRELVWILGFGLGVGIPAALASTRLIESRLFGVQAKDAGIVVSGGLGPLRLLTFRSRDVRTLRD